ncbi:AMIN-like domain-containing (lipo)protein [Mycobacterium neglectum]|uniref:AMIN-like domain-containing (lipo)protein n=1 Tax=Mycobacterium neglectum TaxID=242737 RepID=UPI001145B72B|nr:hypothetical protein [Mycobacterium neglectum]
MRRCCVAAIAALMMLPGCAAQSSDVQRPPPSEESSAVATTPPSGGVSTAEVREVRSGDTAHLVEVRLAGNDGFDRVVLEFADRVPGYTVGYQSLPARADASGAEIPLPGASAVVQVSLHPATGAGWGGDTRTYFGPSTIAASTTQVTEVKSAGDFEAVLTWVVGLRDTVPFRVLVLDGPPRLVIDFQQ